MSGESVSRWRMFIFRTFLLISCFIHCLCGKETCQHIPESDCVIDAVFRNIQANGSVEVLVKCSNDDELSANQFSDIDEIIWNGCKTPENLKALGLRKIPRKNRVKKLKIENFAVGVLDSEIFEGFIRLRILEIRGNSIGKVSSLCFRGLRSLHTLLMIENNLKWLDAWSLSDLPMLKALEVHESQHLLMGNHQFRANQTLDVVLEIYDMEIDLLEHLFIHARNLSISLSVHNEVQGCHQSKLNGYRGDWIVESLKLENVKCGFVMENVEAIKSLTLIRAVELDYSEIQLKELPNLEKLEFHRNLFVNFSSLKLSGSLSSLKVLDLSDNVMTEIDMRMLETFTSLTEINLERNLLAKLSEMNLEKFENIKLFVNGNSFDCSWLESIASSKAFANFVYGNNFKSLNVDGLSCQNNKHRTESFPTIETRCASHFIDPVDCEGQRELMKLKQNRYVLEPEDLLIIVWVAFLLGLAVTLLSIYLYRKRQMLRQAPFYHLLRDSLIRPIADVRITLRRDFKEIISRNLPPTNYEHPISFSDSNVTEMTDVAANTSHVYEEIPPKIYQEVM